MLCLSFLIPGKAGRIIRRVLVTIGAVVILYALCWALILKGLSLEPTDSFIDKDGFILVDLKASNKSFGDIEIIDLNVYDKGGKIASKYTEDLPTIVPKYGSRDIRFSFEPVELDSVELTVKTLFLQRRFKNKLRR